MNRTRTSTNILWTEIYRISLQEVLLRCLPGNNASGNYLLPKYGKSDKVFGTLSHVCFEKFF